MPHAHVVPRLPVELADLLDDAHAAAHDAAWATFLETHSRLLLHVAGHATPNHDAAMDAYEFLIEELSRDNYRRLRTYHHDGHAKFTTWLVVVARRLCVDFVRHRYGRRRRWATPRADWRTARRSLSDLLVGLNAEALALRDASDPASELIEREQWARVAAALTHLSAADLLMVKLRFEDDRTLDDIARIMGYRSRTETQRHLKRVLQRLRPEVDGLA